MPLHPDRSLALAGASNFRDLGGYQGSGGRTVRWRKLFRSDHLAALTPEDARTLGELGVGRAFDFRDPRLPERARIVLFAGAPKMEDVFAGRGHKWYRRIGNIDWLRKAWQG